MTFDERLTDTEKRLIELAARINKMEEMWTAPQTTGEASVTNFPTWTRPSPPPKSAARGSGGPRAGSDGTGGDSSMSSTSAEVASKPSVMADSAATAPPANGFPSSEPGGLKSTSSDTKPMLSDASTSPVPDSFPSSAPEWCEKGVVAIDVGCDGKDCVAFSGAKMQSAPYVDYIGCVSDESASDAVHAINSGLAALKARHKAEVKWYGEHITLLTADAVQLRAKIDRLRKGQ